MLCLMYKNQLTKTTIFFTSITQKFHEIYKRVLEGANDMVCGLNMAEETAEPENTHRP